MHRHVRHLRLACIQEDHARHGRILLEDALRTASFGDEGRLVLIRKLNVGRIPLRSSATHWSQALEQSYRRLQPVALSVDSPAADRAAAVYFANAYEPWLRVAVRAVAGQPCPEWYWAPALPGWTSRQNSAETLRLAFRALSAQGGLKLTLLLLWRLRSLAPLLQSLQLGDLDGVQRELIDGSSPPRAAKAGPEADDHARVPPLRLAHALDPVEAAIAASWPPGDLRRRWLATAHLTREANTGPATPFAPDVTPAAIDQLVQFWSDRGLTQTPAQVAEPPAQPAIDGSPRPAPESPNLARRNPEPAAVDRTLTRAGGLFFVVPLLARTGLLEFITTLPVEQRAPYPWHVLRLILRHALGGTPACRPSKQVKTGAPSPSRAQLEVEGNLASDPLRIALGDLPESPRDLGRWLIRANRQALRLTGLNLRQIVLRAALVSWSPTHTDLFFRPGDADVRLRRAGLDVDPGWVPWLNRVIHYHYNRET